ncbi:RNA cytosine-C(5)-methyltransferase NSUN2-like isoform X2 [Ptychodera flava]|uniref:RNA cytosine-C(5)-methyltransferase NSUN2-like isoform X2 n=1 Tax=Ptychodera flava TaxID=63121 RepID=UPI00396A58F2
MSIRTSMNAQYCPILRKKICKTEGERQVSGNKRGKGLGYAEIQRANEAFESYYKAQGIIPEGEWDQFMSILQVNLPATFRITGFKSHAQQLLQFLKGHYFKELVDVEVDGQAVEKPYPLPWFPDELAWQLNLSRGNIRKIPALERLHSFLITETESGNISRQESVSMIPPLLLDVQPHHKVFDMCAAPGSKTGQLIEMLHADESQSWPSGFVMANDSDNKRCYIMVHQAKRLNSPCVMIVNNDATIMPSMQIPDKDTGQLKQLKFDRVLCDVPCSADGTLRKNYLVWKRWSVHNGFTLHPLQLQILTRGVEVLEIGGRLVYSTCSFNPIENEAVVGSLLSRSQGAMELVDCSHELPNLKRIPGVTTWKVMNENGKVFPGYEDVPNKNKKRIKQSMFPTTDVDKLNLDRCIRLLPHHQDSGGFFIAVLQKVSGLPWTRESKQSKETDSTETDGSMTDVQDDSSRRKYNGPPRKKPRFEGYKEDPFIFFKEDEQLWPLMKEFYKIPDSFPHTQLLTRCETGKKRTVYLVNKAIKDIITNNHDKLKIINSGIRVWCRSDSTEVSCGYRLTQEGSASLQSYINNRKVYLTKQDVITLLTEENPFVHKMSPDSRKQINSHGQGSVMFIYEPPADSCPDENNIIVVGWRGKTSVRSFVSKGDRHHILRLCGVNITSTKKKENKGKLLEGQRDEDKTKDDGDDAEEDTELDDQLSGGVEGMEEEDDVNEDIKDADTGEDSKESEVKEDSKEDEDEKNKPENANDGGNQDDKDPEQL